MLHSESAAAAIMNFFPLPCAHHDKKSNNHGNSSIFINKLNRI